MRKVYFIAFITLVAISLNALLITPTHSNPNGAPAGASGAPNDPANGCNRSGCHGGSPTLRSGLIVTNIPSSGYVPGQTYTFTVQIEQAGVSKWGFQISPFSASGGAIGTWVLTDNTQTRFAAGGGSKYVTHTTTGNSGSTGSKSWTFNWTAPAAGNGGINFYAYVMASNNNGNTAGDAVFNETLFFEEASGIGFDALEAPTFELFPNPTSIGHFVIRNNFIAGNNQVKIYDLSGKLVSSETLSIQNQLFSTNGFKTGVYFVSVEGEQGRTIKKLIIQ
jgi:hypothetical protein